jgi:general stress protein 26
MTNADDASKPLADLVHPGTTLMVGFDSAASPLAFRPLTVARVAGDRVEILLDTTEPWAKALHDGDVAHVTLSDTRENTWASLRGTISMTTDPTLIDELWTPLAAAYFDEVGRHRGSRSCGSMPARVTTGPPRRAASAA